MSTPAPHLNLNKTLSKSVRKPPVVRQTLTSKLRAERGDQLQYLKNKLEKIKSTQSSSTSTKENLNSANTFKKPSTSTANYVTKNTGSVSNKLSSNIQNLPNKKPAEIKPSRNATTPKPTSVTSILNKNPSKNNINRFVKQDNNPKPNRFPPMPQKSEKKDVKKLLPVNNIKKSALKTTNTSVVKKTVTIKSPMRKSLSAMHLKRVNNCNRNSAIQRTKSCSDVLSPSQGVRASQEENSFMFRTPTMNKRRSVFIPTPMSSKSVITPILTPNSSTASELKRRLSLWLEKRSKPLNSFHHLRCFGINSQELIDEENKENFEVFILEKNSSSEDLKLKTKENISIANDALYDLQKLIQEGYARDQCEAWLEVISSQYHELEESPQYWECRAALEEARGNYQGAMDCYTNAVTKGAEVENVHELLDNLLEKFSVLNIGQMEKQTEKRKSKSALDARNIFKSSIISFAVKERAQNKTDVVQNEETKFVATPVRRSTRGSRSCYVSTPKIKLCTTLESLESSVRKSLHFETNKALQH